jgi:PEP-CTERM motif
MPNTSYRMRLRFDNNNNNGVGFNEFTTVQFTTANALNLPGGTSSLPVVLVSSPPIGQVTGTIAGLGAEDYYSFLWAGGNFSATASITGASMGASYLFSEGISGTCNTIGSATLDSFSGTISVPNLPAGQYCIGIDADNPNDPAFALTFNTPVSGVVPEPSTFLLLSGGLAGIGIASRRSASRHYLPNMTRMYHDSVDSLSPNP